MTRRETTEMPQTSQDRQPVSLGNRRLTMESPPPFPAAVINITNRCNLRCSHCYLYVEGNPNDPNHQIPDDCGSRGNIAASSGTQVGRSS